MTEGKGVTTYEQLEKYLKPGEYMELAARALGYFQKDTKATIVYRNDTVHIENRGEVVTYIPADVSAASLLIWLLEEPGAKRWQMPDGEAVEITQRRRFLDKEKDGVFVPGVEIPALLPQKEAERITLEMLRRLWQQVKAEQPAAAGDPAEAPAAGGAAE